jgi:hypothetical protein
MAMQIAMGRERFRYFQYFYGTAIVGLISLTIFKKNPATLAPLVPLSFAYAYQYDMFYGDMFEKAQIVADDLIINNPNKFLLPQHSGIVTPEKYNKILGIENGKKK